MTDQANSIRDALAHDGFYITRNLIDSVTVRSALDEIHRLHKLYLELEAQGNNLSDFMIEPFADTTFQDDGLPVLRKIELVNKYSELFERLPRHPDLVALVERVLGPDFLLFRNTLMLKPGNHGSAHGLHQDSSYWYMEPATQITVSIALTDATAENGCFQVIPGSHKSELQEWGEIWREDKDSLTDRDDIDLSTLRQMPLEAGSAIFFDSKLVHGSGPNTTPHPRNTALYAYFPPNVRYIPPNPEETPSIVCPVISGCDGQAEVEFTPVGRRF